MNNSSKTTETDATALKEKQWKYVRLGGIIAIIVVLAIGTALSMNAYSNEQKAAEEASTSTTVAMDSAAAESGQEPGDTEPARKMLRYPGNRKLSRNHLKSAKDMAKQMSPFDSFNKPIASIVSDEQKNLTRSLSPTINTTQP